MSVLEILISICVFGVLLWLVNSFIPMEATVKKILNIVAIVLLCIWLFRAFGLWAYLGHLRV